MTYSFDHSKPIYEQIMEQFLQQMCSGVLKPGEKLPSVRETAVQLGVNPNTVQRTYMELERRGIVQKTRGQGTFVSEDPKVIGQLRLEMAEQQVQLFISSMEKIGFSSENILEIVSLNLEVVQEKEEKND